MQTFPRIIFFNTLNLKKKRRIAFEPKFTSAGSAMFSFGGTVPWFAQLGLQEPVCQKSRTVMIGFGKLLMFTYKIEVLIVSQIT